MFQHHDEPRSTFQDQYFSSSGGDQGNVGLEMHSIDRLRAGNGWKVACVSVFVKRFTRMFPVSNRDHLPKVIKFLLYSITTTGVSL